MLTLFPVSFEQVQQGVSGKVSVQLSKQQDSSADAPAQFKFFSSTAPRIPRFRIRYKVLPRRLVRGGSQAILGWVYHDP